MRWRLLAAAALLLLPGLSAAAAERAVDAGGFPATLAGETSSGPLVVMVAGSGPTDRDGNNAFGVSAGYLRKLAATLAEQGIASLRYDKRGIPGGAAIPPEAEVTFGTYVDDLAGVLAWAAAAHPDRPLVLLGHSEGGLVALRAAGRPGPRALAGLVLVATPGRPPGETLRDQLARLPQPVLGQALAILAALEAGQPAHAIPPSLAGLFRPSVQPFLTTLLALRPAAMLGALDLPVLVIGGGADIQVGRADFDALAAARPDVESRWFASMNHVLTDAPAGFADNVATYADPDAALTAGLADTVAAFARRIGR